MENLVIFFDHLVYYMAIGNILWPFGIFCGNLVYFPRFGILEQEKSGNPALSYLEFFKRSFFSVPNVGRKSLQGNN
jgi:hypothetical protein